MQERSVKTFETPGGHSVVMFDYITGGEMQDIARQVKNKDDLSEQIDAGNFAISIVVRDLDGSPDDLLNRILQLPMPDYQMISAAVSALMDPEKKS